MRQQEKDLLRKVPIFQNLSDQTLDQILGPSFIQTFPAKSTLIEENAPADFLFVILDGLILMSAHSDGEATAVEVLRANDVFILAAVLNNDVCL